jgi:hypothetical protein
MILLSAVDEHRLLMLVYTPQQLLQPEYAQLRAETTISFTASFHQHLTCS